MNLQTALKVLYPPQCLSCSSLVEDQGTLCATCWRDANFIRGLTCESCGVPLPGEQDDAAVAATCDDCLGHPRPWNRGFAALLYEGTGRSLVLALKHGDRVELARPAAAWMDRRLPPLPPETLVVPVPLHWLRFLRRRYNQAACLAKHLARGRDLRFVPDAMIRHKATRSLDGKTRDERFQALDGVFKVNPKLPNDLFQGKPVLLVDDVITSGATLSACAELCRSSGASKVHVAVLARVAKDL